MESLLATSLVFYWHITNHNKLSNLKPHPFITSQFLYYIGQKPGHRMAEFKVLAGAVVSFGASVLIQAHTDGWQN